MATKLASAPARRSSPDGEKYEVLEKIGHGSFGVIHKVRRKADGLVLCRKEVNYVRMNLKEREQLSAELSILKEVRHPNIVAYFEREHYKLSQDLHLYMEYCGNGDLGHYIKKLKEKNEFADEEFVWAVFTQLATALYRCHYGEDAPQVELRTASSKPDGAAAPSAGSPFMILHRDLKPENVFLGENNIVKLGDFGLSKILQAQGFAQTYVGTPYYMSPEICNGEKYTLHSDVWSLGCIIYELCTGTPPFDANNYFNLVTKIKSGRTERIPSHYSSDLQDLISRCLSVAPNRRPDTAELLRQPRMRMARKEQYLADWAAELSRKEALMTDSGDAVRRETEARTRQECEARCNDLHNQIIDQAKTDNLRQLQSQFEAEVQRRVAVEVSRIRAEMEAASEAGSAPSVSSGSRSSTGVSGSGSSSEVDRSFSSEKCSEIHSPVRKLPRVGRRSTRTPFARAHTYSVPEPSPMDITMADPTPARSVSQLNLSPRRSIRSPVMSFITDSDLEVCLESLDSSSAAVDTPTRVRPRMGLRAQRKTGVAVGPKPAASDGPVARRPLRSVPVVLPSPSRGSPQRLQPRRPAPLSPVCNGATNNSANVLPAFRSKRGNDDLLKTAMQNQYNGRTLVELSRDRRARTSQDENGMMKAKAYADAPLWDPSNGMMPSPFLVRTKMATESAAF